VLSLEARFVTGPERSVVIPTFEANPAERRVTRLDSDPEGELRTAFLPHPRQLRESLLGGERKPDRLELMVIDSERVVEEHHHAVAREVARDKPRPPTNQEDLMTDVAAPNERDPEIHEAFLSLACAILCFRRLQSF
jgi:hypothetical protein